MAILPSDDALFRDGTLARTHAEDGQRVMPEIAAAQTVPLGLQTPPPVGNQRGDESNTINSVLESNRNQSTPTTPSFSLEGFEI